jgi:hypothetical protein
MGTVPNPIFDVNGDPYSGAVLKAYLVGTTTNTSIAIAAAGTSPQTSITANAEGKWEVSGNEVIPYIDRECKWAIFANATDAAANTPAYMGFFDNVPQSTTTTSTIIPFNTVALMVADTTLRVGDRVRTLGYASIGNGGGNDYEIVAAGTGTHDNGSYIDLTGSGFQAKAIFKDGIINAKQYGALGDNTTDDTTAIQAAIDYAQNSTASRAVYFPPGEYKITSSLTVTAACTLYSNSKPGPQNYPLTHQGGARINFDPPTITAAITDPSSFALQIDVGTIGAEGFANTHIHHLGFGSTDVRGGSIYVEASVNVDIEYCWFINDKDNYDAATVEAISIYCRNMIVSNIRRNTFKNVGWGIVADDYFNENHILENDFERSKLGMVAIYSDANQSVRNSIRDNNFIGDATYPDTAIFIGGSVKATSIAANTFESIRKNNITVNDVDPLTLASIGTGPTGTTIQDNFFVAAGGGLANSKCISLGLATGAVVIGNTISAPTVNLQSLIGTSASTVGTIYAIGNNIDTVDISSGDPTKVIEDSFEYRGNVNISTGPSLVGWTNDHAGRTWWDSNTSGAQQRSLQVWNGTRASRLKQCGTRTDTTQDTTPEVRGLSSLLCNAASYTITALDEGAAGQTVIIYNQNAGNLTIDCTGTNLVSVSGADLTIAQYAWVKFESLDGTTWVEV